MNIRDWCEADLGEMHAINEACVPGVGTLSRSDFDRLVQDVGVATPLAEIAGEVAGFVLCMQEGLDYASLNYRWISERFERFAYIDRVAVAEKYRGRGIGGALYQATFARFQDRRPVLLAEVNLAPPNPGSLRFHKRHGFEEIGERWEPDGEKGVVYLARAPLRSRIDG
ncbi:GNAT family N-acetyltransferase [Thioalkalivibrio sp. HK1]|uniref:GNAT family N-acetyltransferase n=1 Tax=Thioalkalivibrio sp. HK1 TaxID=1469245 RepID=UPI000471D71C|nr:GNAT family N-acetyltransferase [Thioalkalivibrio sp. HK1]